MLPLFQKLVFHWLSFPFPLRIRLFIRSRDSLLSWQTTLALPLSFFFFLFFFSFFSILFSVPLASVLLFPLFSLCLFLSSPFGELLFRLFSYHLSLLFFFTFLPLCLLILLSFFFFIFSFLSVRPLKNSSLYYTFLILLPVPSSTLTKSTIVPVLPFHFSCLFFFKFHVHNPSILFTLLFFAFFFLQSILNSFL